MSYTIATNNTVTAPYYTSTGTSAPNVWATTTGSGLTDLTPNSLQVKGKAVFEHEVEIIGDLKVHGKSLKTSLEAIEARLAILHPNEELEARWEDLRKLRKTYMELESEIIEKEKMWSILKK